MRESLLSLSPAAGVPLHPPQQKAPSGFSSIIREQLVETVEEKPAKGMSSLPCICHSQGFHTFTFAYTCLLLDSLKCSSCTFLLVLLCFPASASGKKCWSPVSFFQVIVFPVASPVISVLWWL